MEAIPCRVAKVQRIERWRLRLRHGVPELGRLQKDQRASCKKAAKWGSQSSGKPREAARPCFPMSTALPCCMKELG